jgi:hypothetical protein
MRGLEPIDRARRHHRYLLQPSESRLEARHLEGRLLLSAAITPEHERAVENGADEGEAATKDDERKKCG